MYIISCHVLTPPSAVSSYVSFLSHLCCGLYYFVKHPFPCVSSPIFAISSPHVSLPPWPGLVLLCCVTFRVCYSALLHFMLSHVFPSVCFMFSVLLHLHPASISLFCENMKAYVYAYRSRRLLTGVILGSEL